MAEGQGAPEGVTVKALLASCGTDIIGLRDAALISLAYDAGLRVSELVGPEVADLRQVGDSSGRLEIGHSKTYTLGEGALAALSGEIIGRLAARSDERRVGKEYVSTCCNRWSRYNKKKK